MCGGLPTQVENANIIDAYREWLREQPDTPARSSAIGQFLSSLDRRANHASTYGAFLKKVRQFHTSDQLQLS